MLIRAGSLGTMSDADLTVADLLPPALAARLDALDIRSRRVFAGKLQGERRSKRRGRSVEFDDFRPYVAGDDLRHIDWNVYARLDRFFLKLFQEEEDLTVHVTLDASASMLAGSGGVTKLLAAARLAMAAAYVSLANNNRVVMSAIGLPEGGEPVAGVVPAPESGLVGLEPLRGRSSTHRVGSYLLAVVRAAAGAPLGEGRVTSFSAGLRAIASSRTGRGVMVVISDLLIPPAPPSGQGEKEEPGYAAGLRYIAAGEGLFEPFVFQVLAPGELDPAAESPLGGEGPPGGRRSPVWGDLRLLDAETGASREVTVTGELLRRYRAAAARYVASAAAWCRARGIEHALMTSDQAPETAVVDAMRKAGLLA
ncbi:MAG: DUF58 domain-containing protein [Phycisphaerales bacterium]|nr:DUF58 domain-containing protein [Phycisphaerales bacterium]